MAVTSEQQPRGTNIIINVAAKIQIASFTFVHVVLYSARLPLIDCYVLIYTHTLYMAMISSR